MTDDPVPDIEVDGSMDDPINQYSPKIFRDKKILRPTYVPDMSRIVGRDEQISKLENVLKPAAHGDPPGDASVLSKPGTGKTLCAKNVAGRVRAFAHKNGYNVVAAYIDCEDCKTETQVGKALAESAANHAGAEMGLPENGIATTRYFDRVWELLEETDSLIVIVDEIDKLGEDANGVIKRLSDAESNGKAPCFIGTVAISNKTGFYTNLDSRVKSRFQNNDTELIFSPYESSQLQEILENRRDAFFKDALSKEVIPLCSAFGAREHGDARKALDLLLAAGERAETMEKETVEEEDVRAVHEEASTARERELIKTSLDHAQYTLYALAYLTKTKLNEEFSTGEIRSVYKNICIAEGVDAQTNQNVLNHLKDWSEVEITENHHTGGGKGRGSYRKHRLLVDPGIAMETIRENTFHGPVVDSLE